MNGLRDAAIGALLALTGCGGPVGPVVGDWRGAEPSEVVSYPTVIEVILDGAPGAREGTYHYTALTQGILFEGGNRRLDWTDRWQMRPAVVGGQSVELVHLANLAGAHIRDFILTPQGLLVPQADLARPDLSAGSYRVALQPVPRDSFGYGRP